MVANEETFDENSSSECNYKEQYKEMKRKLRLLIYVGSIVLFWKPVVVFVVEHLSKTSVHILGYILLCLMLYVLFFF